MFLLIVYGLVSIFFSFLCSILEAVLLSVTPTFINIKKQEGKSYAYILEELKKDVDKPLIAILTINTIAHTVGAIMVGVQAESVFSHDNGFSVLGFHIGMVGIVSAIMTALILVASEIIPKTIGATYWKSLAHFSAVILKYMVLFLKYTGILWILQFFTKMIGAKGEHGSVLSREDFSAMTDIAEQEGVFQENESTVIRNLINFKDILVKSVMTPRTVLFSVDEKVTLNELFEQNPHLQFSRIPVYKESPDHITGYFLKDIFLESIINQKGELPVSSIKREILIFKEDHNIYDVFNQFTEKREHIALVMDEFGGTAGLVTMEDVLETLLGLEIVDEFDQNTDMQEVARNLWKIRAKRLGIIDLEDENKES